MILPNPKAIISDYALQIHFYPTIFSAHVSSFQCCCSLNSDGKQQAEALLVSGQCSSLTGGKVRLIERKLQNGVE